MKIFKFLAIAMTLSLGAQTASPCSRIVWRGDSTDIVMVGRTLDWRTPIPTNLYVYPAGMKKVSMPEGPRYEWTSKYGSVIAVGYDGGVTEGMNERGLVMNGLFCKEAIYREAIKGEDTPVMSMAMYVSWFLDNFATVAEVNDWLATNDFAIWGEAFDGGTVSLLHWAVTDLTGRTLIMEYVDGHLTTYLSEDYQVLTNDPVFSKMQAINGYWQNVGGMNMLPGGVRSADRFVRADYFIHHVPTTGVDADGAFTELSSVVDNVAVPYGYEIAGQPNLSSTQWRSIADINRLRYYFKMADSQGYYYIDLEHLMLKPGSPVLKLDNADHSGYYGCVNDKLKVSKPFTPMY